ncbi:MAG: Ig-like domain-containing protein, partial [Chloroflexaceae bacterium]|nr:Ig-like domain-containing protein [Chloroflexaceae bacterium]
MALLLMLGGAVRLLLPVAPWIERPALVRVSPAPGAADVLPRSELLFGFNQPMNQASVERLIQIEPPIEGNFTWRDDGRTLVFTPGRGFAPDATYTMRLAAGALSRWWVPLETPLVASFRTTNAPAVVAALPRNEGVATDAALALVFSQAIVGPEQIDQPASLSQLQIEPPLDGEARWLNQHTLLLRPARPMLPDTPYRATIGAGLADLRGAQLEQPFTWTWRTRGPELLARRPADGQQNVGTRQPLVLTLSQPLEINTLRASLQISPTVTGELATTTLITGTQVVTFTPTVGWEAGRSYNITLASQAPTPTPWRFGVEPPPTLVGRLPGDGQLLVPGQAIRLLFNTPMDEATLRAGINLEPAVANLDISSSGTEVRLLAELRASTTYTLTIAPTVASRNGAALGQPGQVRFQTAPAPPALAVPGLNGRLLTLPTGNAASLPLERTNISALDMALYTLDEATLLRTLEFSEEEWRNFLPERYNLPLIRAWRETLNDPPGQIARSGIALVENAASPLAPGAYYLRLRTPEGQQADLVLLVSRVALALKLSQVQAIVWATDANSGAPLADVPVTLYWRGAVVAQGRSDGSGLWQTTLERSASTAPYLVVAGGADLALVRSDWLAPASAPLAAAPTMRLVLFTDQPTYTPGATMRLHGFVRQIGDDGSLVLPAANTRMSLTLQGPTSTVTSTSLLLPESGIVSATVPLTESLPPGSYTVQAAVGGSSVSLPLNVVQPDAHLKLALVSGDAGQLQLQASSAAAPAAGLPVTWEATAVPAPPPPRDGFVFSDDEREVASRPFSGTGSTDGAGQFTLPLPETATLSQTLRLAVSARVQEPGGASAIAFANLVARPPGPQVGLRLPSRIVVQDERPTIELLTLGPDGAPASGAQVSLEVLRRVRQADGTLRESRAIAPRNTVSDAQGRADLTLVTFDPGEYRVVAQVGNQRAAASFWVTGPGAAPWVNAPGRVGLVADRERYQPGDVARLLVTLPDAQASTLLTLERNGTASTRVQPVRAGELITVSVTPDLAPLTPVSLLAAAGGPLRVGETSLALANGLPRLTTLITPDRAVYAPGEVAQFSLSTSDEQNQAVAASVWLGLVRDDGGPLPDLLNGLTPLSPGGFSTALSEGQAGASAARPNRATSAGEVALLQANLQTLVTTTANGPTVVRLPLPQTGGRWRVVALAASGANLFGQADATIALETPLALQTTAPARLRPGDEAEIEVTLGNSSGQAVQAQLTLDVGGATLVGNGPVQRVEVPASGENRVAWNANASAVPTVTLRLRASATGLSDATTTLSLPVLADLPLETTTLEPNLPLSRTVAISNAQALGGSPSLELAVAPNSRAAVIHSARVLMNRPQRSVEEEASLLLLSTALARSATAEEEGPWRVMVLAANARLDAMQNLDGGWGWWAGSPSHPFVTGYVLEAQATARAALQLREGPGDRSLQRLDAFYATADADMRAYFSYVRRLLNRADLAVVRLLQSEDLSP